jgi:hypothetical protein
MSDDVQATGPALRSRAQVVRLEVVVPEAASGPAEEQLAYARVLDGGMKVGFVSLVVTFALYMTGVLAPHVPVEELPRLWALPVKEYLAATGIHGGWSWLGMLARGDFLNFVGIAFLASVAMICYATITPIFFRKNDRIYGCLAVLEIAVLALAASGVLKAGGH